MLYETAALSSDNLISFGQPFSQPSTQGSWISYSALCLAFEWRFISVVFTITSSGSTSIVAAEQAV